MKNARFLQQLLINANLLANLWFPAENIYRNYNVIHLTKRDEEQN